MNKTIDIQNEIIRLKNENDFCILAHSYQTHDIIEVADYVGDSFALSKYAAQAKNTNILMCGVRFMAETAKILSPDKNVILSNPDAGCPMAEQLSVKELKSLKLKYKNCAVVAYINTTSELKCECDVCVTSASALDIVKKLPNKDILFIPDCNLGSWIQKQIPEKNFYFINGGCPIHMSIAMEDVINAKKTHPDALLLVHPECVKEVSDMADFVGSTTEIMNFVENSSCNEFVIGTDNTIAEHLKFIYPEKSFFVLSKNCICRDMRLTTLMDVYNCIKGKSGEIITLSPDIMKGARRCIDNMLQV